MGETPLVAALRETDGRLRDAWLFDEAGHEPLFVRSDVAEQIEAVDVERFVDNERYGYVTRETYESLHYTEYAYTVRGFDAFVQFRTFLDGGDGDRVGLMASFDPDGTPDFRALAGRLADVAATESITVGSE